MKTGPNWDREPLHFQNLGYEWTGHIPELPSLGVAEVALAGNQFYIHSDTPAQTDMEDNASIKSHQVDSDSNSEDENRRDILLLCNRHKDAMIAEVSSLTQEQLDQTSDLDAEL